jgi:hypothetical protein
MAGYFDEDGNFVPMDDGMDGLPYDPSQDAGPDPTEDPNLYFSNHGYVLNDPADAGKQGQGTVDWSDAGQGPGYVPGDVTNGQIGRAHV